MFVLGAKGAPKNFSFARVRVRFGIFIVCGKNDVNMDNKKAEWSFFLKVFLNQVRSVLFIKP